MYYKEQSTFCVLGGIIGTASADNKGLLSHIDYTDKFQVVRGATGDTFKVAKIDANYSYTGFIAIGFATQSGEIFLFTVTKASKNGNIILKGTVPDKLVVYKDSDNIIYIKYDIGIDANIFLIGSKNNRCMIKAERVELPNDAEVFIY